MRTFIMLAILGMATFAALPVEAQQVEIEAQRPAPEREARVVPPPLHYETTRPPDADVRYNRRGIDVEHDPAFLEPSARTYQTATSTGRYGLSGWTAPNPAVGPAATNFREVTGWFALGFSITWDGPPPTPRAAPRPPR